MNLSSEMSVTLEARGRRAETCTFRKALPNEGNGLAVCRLVESMLGTCDTTYSVVERPLCEACCRCIEPPENVNPVIASRIFSATGEIIRAGGAYGCTPKAASRLRDRIANHLTVVHSGQPDRLCPPDVRPTAETVFSNSASRLTWRVGVLTAPRAVPTLERTLQSLESAGFTSLSIFAEPGATLPNGNDHRRVIVREQRLGNLANFYIALAQMVEESPDADAFAVFQDDVRIASGARRWCEAQLWPFDCGLVSLFTPRIHSTPSPGWQLATPGFWRVHGGQALVFRSDVLHRFLADPHVLRSFREGRHGDDAVVAAWAGRQRVPLAYHSPSLVQHVGHVSSIYPQPDRRAFADAVDSVEQIDSWRRPQRRSASIGVVGWHTATGLGYQTFDMARHLGVDRWLVPIHPQVPTLPDPRERFRMSFARLREGEKSLRSWCRGLDWVLFAERPYFPRLAEAARAEGTAVACVPNWERLHPHLDWLRCVDVMLCPTRHTFACLTDWRSRYGFGWDVVYVPWPIDLDRFPFRQRDMCRRFLFINGWGGGGGTRLDGTPTGHYRKGIDVIAGAARLAPQLSFIVYSQTDDLPPMPSNVELRLPPKNNRSLYLDGDVCVQPSRWEGIGLQLLECQASGLPLVTVDFPPMNEYRPLELVPVKKHEVVDLAPGNPVVAPVIEPESLAETLLRCQGRNLSEESQRSRQFVEREHTWERAKAQIAQHLILY